VPWPAAPEFVEPNRSPFQYAFAVFVVSRLEVDAI
jgi:hypothetical protein